MAPMQSSGQEFDSLVQKVAHLASTKYSSLPTDFVHPSQPSLHKSSSSVVKSVPVEGISVEKTLDHLITDICPALSGSPSPRYFGFVTGGSTPAAQLADFLATIHDQNVQVHLPQCSISTSVEDATLRMVLDLLNLEAKEWPGRTFTTGATASNLLGLACGRNQVLANLNIDVGEDGFCGKEVQVLCASPHASIRKAASLVGIGRSRCIDLADGEDPYGVSFDLSLLEKTLADNKLHGRSSIVVASLGEVNTGLSTRHLDRVRLLCDTYQAWLHLDAAFAVFAGLYPPLSKLMDDLHLADSLCIDAHKWLNVPYDCAMFFTKRLDILKNVCASGPASYLTSAISNSNVDESDAIESPLNVGIENSRRFRALPLYASLLAYGKNGYSLMVERNLRFARSLDTWLRSSQWYDVLSPLPGNYIGENLARDLPETTNVILFSIKPTLLQLASVQDDKMAKVVTAINASRILYLTGTIFQGRSCARIAVSNWRTGLAKQVPLDARLSLGDDESSEDLDLVTGALQAISHDVLSCLEQ